MNKKKVFTLALAVCLIAILSMGSLAWFSDSDSVNNNFYVGDGGENADDIFSVDIWEQVDSDGDGEPDLYVGKEEDGGSYDYKEVVPGDMLYKAVNVTNTGSNDEWVRVSVTVNNASVWAQLETKYGFNLEDLLIRYDMTKLTDSTMWTHVAGETVTNAAADTVTYVFYLNNTLKEGRWTNFIYHVEIPEELNQHDLALFGGNLFSMSFKVDAIQVQNINADNAIDAFAIVSGANG